MKGMESEQGRAVIVRHEQLLFFTFNSWTLAEGRWTWRAGTLKVSKKELAETQGGGKKVEIQSQLKVKKICRWLVTKNVVSLEMVLAKSSLLLLGFFSPVSISSGITATKEETTLATHTSKNRCFVCSISGQANPMGKTPQCVSTWYCTKAPKYTHKNTLFTHTHYALVLTHSGYTVYTDLWKKLLFSHIAEVKEL